MTSPERRMPDLAERILPRLGGFFALLRGRGLPVGVGAELDLAQALTSIRMLDRPAFLDACRITLAKSPADLARLEAAFEDYWSASFVPPDPEGRFPVAGPARPPPDGVITPAPSAVNRISADPAEVVRFGMYSPDAPPLGHVLSMPDRRRRSAIWAGARRFRRYAATLPGRRYERSRRGSIDYLSTARHSLRHGGEWVEVQLHRRKRLRAELVILWDVSGSMREHDGDLFTLVYSLQRSVRRCRIFGFSTELRDLTGAVRARAYGRAAEAIARSLRSSGGGTRIGRCLEEFVEAHGDLIHPWTTVVVVSDGWDLGDTALLGRALERIRRRCHLLVWVNPYANDPRFKPATAGMREALPHVDLFLAPTNFETSRPFRSAPTRPVAS